MAVKDQLFTANSKFILEKRQKVEIPECNLTLYAHRIPTAYKARLGLLENKSDIFSWIIIYSIHDEDGKRVFSEEDFDKVSQLDDFIQDPLYDAAATLNGFKLTPEEIEGNSAANQSESSSSA